MVPSPVPVSPNVDSTTPSPPPEASQVRTTSVNLLSATAQPMPAPEQLMPRTLLSPPYNSRRDQMIDELLSHSTNDSASPFPAVSLH
jgi:hypothetical protein